MQAKQIYKYLTALSVPLAAFLSIYLGGIWVFITPVYAFLFLPVLEFLWPPDIKNLSATEEEIAKKDPVYDFLLYLFVPAQYGLLLFFLITVHDAHLRIYETMGMVLSMGICCGVIGINVAHELGHRKNGIERFLAKSLLLTSLYMHFIIEHNKGHHKRVATAVDPSSARMHENIYRFYCRTIPGTLLSAWHIQKTELQQEGKRIISAQNEMLWFIVIEFAFIILIGLVAGIYVMFAFLFAALIGILLLEAVNYIEHYGLSRKPSASGDFERVQPWHSWNSDFVIGRLVLFELTRHSDHHYLASRKYQILRHLDDAPQLPAGYPAMIIMALIPPLFFRIMDPRVEKILASH